MTQYTVQNGQNLWKIVKQQYGLTNNADIQKKVNEIVKLNKLSDGGKLIFPNQTIDLPEISKETSVFDAKPATSAGKGLTAASAVSAETLASQTPAENKSTEPQMGFIPGITKLPQKDAPLANQESQTTNPATNVKTPTTDTTQNAFIPGISSNSASDYVRKTAHIQESINKDNPFDSWGQDCASSINGVDEKTGNFTYSKDISNFDLTSDEYQKLKSENPQKADELYKQKLLDVSAQEVKMYDKDGDNAYDLKEHSAKELADSEKYVGAPLDKDDIEMLSNETSKAHAMLDLDGDTKVGEKEFATFLGATDNDKNGKITPDEYSNALAALGEEPGSEGYNDFKNKLVLENNTLFGADANDKKTK